MKRCVGSIKDCLQHEPAFCTVACPFHLDVRDFIAKIQRGGFNAAYRTHLNAVGFPGIVAELCPQPCQKVCPRKSAGGAVSMRLLEKAAIANARNLEPNSYNIPPKQKKVAVIGAGPSGLACTLRLAAKGYEVTVFEKSDRIGGHLQGLLSPQVFMPDIERQFMYVEYELRLNTEIRSLESLPNFDAVYVATGAAGEDFGLSSDEGGAFASSKAGAFIGGSLIGADTMRAIADGLQVCAAIERYLKTGSMNQPGEMHETKLQIEMSRIAAVERIQPSDGRVYSQDEAMAEAKRCLRCACDACYRACDLMNYFKKFPKRIAEEVHLTIHPGTLDGNGTLAMRLISTCNQCGLCGEVCPEKIDTGDLFLISHRALREKGAMPWAFHDFFLRDMAMANSDARLSRLPVGYDKSRFVFFPGCQIGASDPRYVVASYRFLLDYWPDTSLLLACCGAPAEWAGDEPIRNEVTAKLREDWIALGRPKAVFACPTCKLIFGRHLPEIEGIFLYDLIEQQKMVMPNNIQKEKGTGTAAVFDPCASRDEAIVQQAVRKLAKRAGFRLEPLPMEGKLAQCCSWGGQVSIAHPPYARHMVKERISESIHPYITYCINCRDIFAAAKKPAWHILDIMFGLNGADRLPPTVTDRQRNRIALKRQVLETLWKEAGEKEESRMNLIIAPELRQKLSAAFILETDIAAVIEFCEKSGRKVCDQAAGSFGGYLKIGHMTYWAEYRIKPGGEFELINAYSHRMSLEEK